ncbi:acyl-CoA thioesterase [Undibacterium arcticum]
MTLFFRTSILVRFGDCDPAGIVFLSALFLKCSTTWWKTGARWAWSTVFRALHMEQGLGLPTVHIETDFVAASELGETLCAELQVRKFGATSITLGIRLLGPDGADRVRCTLVLVLLDLHKRSAVSLPEALRTRIARFLRHTVTNTVKKAQ